MIRKLGHQHLGQQSGCWYALVNDLRRYRCLRQCFTVGTDPFATHMALDREHARRVVQLLGHIFANALELAAALAGCGVGFVVDIHARQVGWQSSTFGLLGWLGIRLRWRREVLEFLLDGGKVFVEGLIEQADLCAVELLPAAAELMALEHSHLVRELINLGLAVHQFLGVAADRLVQLGDLLVLLCNFAHQAREQFAQFLRAQLVQ